MAFFFKDLDEAIDSTPKNGVVEVRDLTKEEAQQVSDRYKGKCEVISGRSVNAQNLRGAGTMPGYLLHIRGTA